MDQKYALESAAVAIDMPRLSSQAADEKPHNPNPNKINETLKKYRLLNAKIMSLKKINWILVGVIMSGLISMIICLSLAPFFPKKHIADSIESQSLMDQLFNTTLPQSIAPNCASWFKTMVGFVENATTLLCNNLIYLREHNATVIPYSCRQPIDDHYLTCFIENPTSENDLKIGALISACAAVAALIGLIIHIIWTKLKSLKEFIPAQSPHTHYKEYKFLSNKNTFFQTVKSDVATCFTQHASITTNQGAAHNMSDIVLSYLFKPDEAKNLDADRKDEKDFPIDHLGRSLDIINPA